MSNEKEKQIEITALAKVPVNYLFFGFYFLFISFIHVYHVLLIEPGMTFSRYFFLFYAVMQCAIETLLLVLFANAIKIFFPPKGMAFYSIFVFFLMLTHVIDFPLVRFMDMSFWYALNFISAESPQNFLELLYASNVSLVIWCLAGVAGFSVLFSGIYLYRVTERLTKRRPLVVHYPMLAASLCTFCFFLMSWDYSTHKWSRSNYAALYQKTLPWKSTFMRERQEYFALSNRLKAPPSQEDVLNRVEISQLSLEKKPDIFLFIVESLREDFITEQQAPHLNKFKQDNVSFDLALANANGTHISWFSLFYSQYPLYWDNGAPLSWKKGSIPLLLLQKMGYKIHCYSSARLNYYQMNQRIFGENDHLAHELISCGENNKEQPHVRDRLVIEKLIEEMKKGASGGRVFIVFLDSTHLDYSWPHEEGLSLFPCEEKINYIKAALSNSGLEMIKNRYRNSLHYVDSLFGRFSEMLNSYAGGKEAVVVFTGDHAEEFYEQGHLFHASSLSQAQTHIPLYFKFGTLRGSMATKRYSMSCHMDIFPTLFHYLTGRDCMDGILQGQSIFRTTRWPYTVIARFNASRSPCEFCIHDGKAKLTASFSDERDIFNAKGLRIISLKNSNDELILHDLTSLKEQFGSALDHIFSP